MHNVHVTPPPLPLSGGGVTLLEVDAAGWGAPTKSAACRNVTFLSTYEKTVANSSLLNLMVGFMLKVGGVLDGLEQESQEMDLRYEKVLHARGRGHEVR